MASLFSSKESKVVVVDPSGPVRQLMADTIRTTLGFESVEGKASIQDTLQFLEADRVDWVILSLSGDQPVNALHFLKLCSEHADLKHVRISLCLEENERYVLPAAFELGLLSWHPKPYNKDSLSEEMKQLQTVLEAENFREPLTAAHYLRKHLRQTKSYAAQMDLERNLLDVYPGNAEILLNLAEPQALLGRKEEAKKTLSQVKLLDPKLSDKADELAKASLGEALPVGGDATGGGFNILGINEAVVIDSDDSTSKGVEETLKSLGVATVHRFADGDAAWQFFEKAKEPQLIVLEWRIPQISGPLLIQRVRQHGFLNVPIVVLSSLLKPDDMPLVREIGVANIIQKPLNRDLFIPSLIWTMQQERLPTEQQTLERKIRQLLKAGKKDEAEPLRVQLLADPQVPMSRKRLIEAEYAYANADYVLARDAALESLKLAGDGILVLNLLGKAFMRLKNHEAALKCFKKAQELSPNNIERLCNIAEANTELGNHAEAGDAIADAKALDPDAKAVAEAEVRVAITKGDTKAAKQLLGDFESLDSLVAYMNNKAVAYAKCGYAQDAVDLYHKTIESIPEDRVETRAIVSYNLALALVRDGDLEGAIKKLDVVLEAKIKKIEKKAQSLRERLKVAVDKGIEFKMKASDASETPKQPVTAEEGSKEAASELASYDDYARLLATVETKRGDLCCYLIFTSPDPADTRTSALLANMPRFQRRDSIERAESLGAERTKQSA